MKDKETTHGWVSKPKGECNGNVTGIIHAYPSGVKPNVGDQVMKVLVHKKDCVIKGGRIYIKDKKVGDVLTRYTPDEFRRKVLKEPRKKNTVAKK
jgi:hypothetical protein